MKYLFRLLLVAPFLLILVSCSSNPEKDIISNWAYPVDSASSGDMHVFLEFKNNGVVTQSSVIFDNTAREGKLGPKSTYRYNITGNKLLIDTGGNTKLYTIKFNMTKSKMYMTDDKDGKENILEKSNI